MFFTLINFGKTKNLCLHLHVSAKLSINLPVVTGVINPTGMMDNRAKHLNLFGNHVLAPF